MNSDMTFQVVAVAGFVLTTRLLPGCFCFIRAEVPVPLGGESSPVAIMPVA